MPGPDRLARDLLLGALAGGLATWSMGKVTTYLYERQDPDALAREQAVSGKPTYQVAAEKAARLAGLAPSEADLGRAGQALHWALGIGAGALYGALRRRLPGADAAQGLAFGLAFFLVVDEFLNTALGFAKAPPAYPWQTHARGLAGHLAYGLVAETTLDLADRAALGAR
ncbi:MAG TPA: DUF1440 domain-containing protein [Thermodesulfobacteriota bacterium]